MAKMNYSFAQNELANNEAGTGSPVTLKNVKTQTINVGGTDFYYRKLGENNPGIPVIFLNHLSATMNECDPSIMDSLASSHQIICFDNRGVGATKGTTPQTVSEMATDAIAFNKALGYQRRLQYFSMRIFASQKFSGFYYMYDNNLAMTRLLNPDLTKFVTPPFGKNQ
jgi:hypothetical protein